MSLPSLNQPFVAGSIPTPVGEVPQVSSSLRATDYWGMFKVRWRVGRMRYKIEPGLYALGRPDDPRRCRQEGEQPADDEEQLRRLEGGPGARPVRHGHRR